MHLSHLAVKILLANLSVPKIPVRSSCHHVVFPKIMDAFVTQPILLSENIPNIV